MNAFFVDSINAELVPKGLVYSAGFGRLGRAQFHLGRLEREDFIPDRRALVERENLGARVR